MSDKVDKMAKVRAAKKPAEYKNVHPDVKALPESDYLCLKNVKEWEKHNKDRVKDLKYQIRRMEKGKEQNALIREMRNREGYLANIRTYLDTGTWLDLFWGQDQENTIRYRTIAVAYDKDGFMKIPKPLDFYEDT